MLLLAGAMNRWFGFASSVAATFAFAVACGGSSSDGGSSGSSGSAGAGASAGVGGAGASGGSSGSSGSGAVAGAAGASGGCPDDWFSADGTPCSDEGKTCSSDCSDPCQFCQSIICQNGKWRWMEAFPDPNCDDGSTGGSCGGKQGLTCGSDEYCDYPGHCGATDQLGTCTPRPEGCTADCPGVCGCDGKFYCNACGAAAQGIDVTDDLSCLADAGQS